MRKLKLILFYLIITNQSNSQKMGYQIMNVTELIKLRQISNAKFFFQDENTRATIYSINDGKYTLSPASGSLGLLIDNKNTLDSILKTRIPIEKDPPSPFEKYINDIRNFNFSKIVDDLFYKLKLNFNVETFKEDDYVLIEKAIKKYPKENRYHDLLVPLGLFIGGQILKKKCGKWNLHKEYAYNPYFIPFIEGNGFSIEPFYKLSQQLLNLERKKLNIQESIDNPFVLDKN